MLGITYTECFVSNIPLLCNVLKPTPVQLGERIPEMYFLFAANLLQFTATERLGHPHYPPNSISGMAVRMQLLNTTKHTLTKCKSLTVTLIHQKEIKKWILKWELDSHPSLERGSSNSQLVQEQHIITSHSNY